MVEGAGCGAGRTLFFFGNGRDQKNDRLYLAYGTHARDFRGHVFDRKRPTGRGGGRVMKNYREVVYISDFDWAVIEIEDDCTASVYCLTDCEDNAHNMAIIFSKEFGKQFTKSHIDDLGRFDLVAE